VSVEIGELANDFALRSSVALTERVSFVHVAEDHSKVLGEFVGGWKAKPSDGLKLARHVVHSGAEAVSRMEGVLALRDVDRTELARPVVDVLEQMTMHRHPVPSGPRTFDECRIDLELLRSQSYGVRLEQCEFFGVMEPGKIAENPAIGIDIGINEGQWRETGARCARYSAMACSAVLLPASTACRSAIVRSLRSTPSIFALAMMLRVERDNFMRSILAVSVSSESTPPSVHRPCPAPRLRHRKRDAQRHDRGKPSLADSCGQLRLAPRDGTGGFI